MNFVNVMQGNIELISELNKLKQMLHEKYPQDKGSYQNEKESFYSRINKVL